MAAEFEDLIAQLFSGDDHQAEAAALALGPHGREALPELQELLHSPEEEKRWWATRALAEIDAPETPELLQMSLQDPAPSVRQCAALALRQRPDAQAINDLVAALNDNDRLTATLAADALISIGEPAGPALLVVLEKGRPQARIEAARALAIMADQRAIPLFFHALDGESHIVEYWAREGLERMGVGMDFFKP